MDPWHVEPAHAARDLDPAPPVERAGPVRAAEERGPGLRRRRRAARGRVKLLFVAANVAGEDALALDEEYRAIEQRIRAARHGDAVQLIPRLAARRGDLQDALLEHRPDIVHFAGHGSAQGGLALRGDGPGSDPVSPASLAALFGVLGDRVVLVVLNACFASEQAEAIRGSVALTIGMRARIEDRAAIGFASALYGALAYGRSVRDAFELGVAAIDARHRAEPELLCAAGVDPRRVALVTSRSRAGLAAAGAVAVIAAFAAGGWLREAPRAEPRLAAVRGMVRFAAAEPRPGVRAAVGRSAACARLDEPDDCGAPPRAGSGAAPRVAAFELDVREVTNDELAAWLNAVAPVWTADSYGRIMTRQDRVPLALASDDCFGALAIGPDGRVLARPDAARWPAACVTWYGAAEYCRAQHKRLPLAAEWERAARGAEGRPFPWGSDPPRHDGVAFDLRDGAAAHPRDVASSPQDVSAEAVHDLGGNVAEWVEDGGGAPDTRMIRGGSWGSRDLCHLRGSGCKRIAAGKYSKDVGFRCASSVTEASREPR